MKLWPRTLGMQLIVVTAMAIFLSNGTVALWFELSRERLSETELTERLLDRTASLSTLLAILPPKARVDAVKALEGKLWRFHIQTGKYVPQPMNDKEAKFAARLRAILPPKVAKLPVAVHYKEWTGEGAEKLPPGKSMRSIVLAVPVVRGTELIATFIELPGPPWPTELTIAAILAVLVASAAAAYIARRVARPLSELAQAAAVIARGDPAPRVPEAGPEDVRNAAQAFNTMTDQVTRTLESQRHLLSAVGHDLRTPLTAMRINIEFVEDAELRDRLQRNLDELQDLTEAVLSAAKGAGGEVRRQIDLASLVESVCADLDDLGEPVEFEARAPAPLSCRANEVRRAVRNLVENAVAYGKKAHVRMIDTSSAFEVVVDDEGPGIPPEDRQRVFEPFVRLETSRNLETGGTGLGLTLVKAIAESHGGRVHLEDAPTGGLRARLVLPRQTTLSKPVKEVL